MSCLHLRDIVVRYLNSGARGDLNIHHELTGIGPRKECFANQRIRGKTQENGNADSSDDHTGTLQCLADLSYVPCFESSECEIELVHYDTKDAYSPLPAGCRVRIPTICNLMGLDIGIEREEQGAEQRHYGHCDDVGSEQ